MGTPIFRIFPTYRLSKRIKLTEKEKESILANAALYLEKSKEYRAHAAKQA